MPITTQRLIFLLTLLIAFVQLLFVMDTDITTYLYAGASLLSFIVIIKLRQRILITSNTAPTLWIKLYFLLNLIAILRGFFEAENYWDWKEFLLNSLYVMLLPTICFIGLNYKIVQKIFSSYIYILPIGIIVFILSRFSNNTDGFGRYMSPCYFLILFLPYCKRKIQIGIWLLAIFSFLSDLEARSNLIRIGIAIAVVLASYFHSYVSKKIFLILYTFLFAIPIILFSLGVFQVFNVFQMNNYTSNSLVINGKNGENADLMADTRTFIYREQLGSLLKRHSIVWGESASAGYESISFQESTLTSKGRPASEVGILNVLMYTGIVGVILFTLVFYFAGYYSILYAKNHLSISLGFFIAFRWIYSWVEEFTNYDMNYFFLWLVIGLCFSKSFAQLNNFQIKNWVQNIFSTSSMI
jgi:hypothetical protein